MTRPANNVLFLTLSVFSDTGGIQKVCRTLSKTLNDLVLSNGRPQVLSLCDHNRHIDSRYVDIHNFRGFNYRRLPFCLNSICLGLAANVIIISHINLIPVACLIKTANPTAQIIVLAHGIEVWRPIRWWKITFLKKYCQIWSVSQFTSNKIQELHGLNGRQISVLHNCLDPFFVLPQTFEKPSHLMKRYHIKDGTVILLGINRMASYEHEKGYDQVLNSLPALLQAYPNLCYLLAGEADPIEAARLNARIVKENLQQHVQLIGYIEEAELSNHYLLADIFILISRKEGFGLVLLEAAACGCKIICGNIDGSTEAVLDGKLGMQINPYNNRQLEFAVLASLKNKRNCYKSKNLQKTCLEHFSFPAYNKKVKQLLTHFINVL